MRGSEPQRRRGRGGDAERIFLRLLCTLCVSAVASASAQDEPPPPGYERTASEDVLVERMAMDEASARAILATFKEARSRVEAALGQRLGESPPLLVIAPTDDEFDRRARGFGASPESIVLALAFPDRNAVLVRASRVASGEAFFAPTLRHELAHLALAGVARRGRGALPRWLEEGLAEHAAGVELGRDEELELASEARFGTLELFSSLETSFPPHGRAVHAYRMSLGFVRWLDARAKPDGVRSIVADLAAAYTPDAAFRRTMGVPVRTAEAEWKVELSKKHSVLESLVRSGPFWWGLVSLLAVFAFLRHLVVRRRLLAKMKREEGE